MTNRNNSFFVDTSGDVRPGRVTAVAVVGILAFLLLLGTFFTIRSGQRGIVFTFGKITAVRGEGIWGKIPIIQSVEKVSIRTQRSDAKAEAVSKNMQSVSTTVTLNYHLNPFELEKLYSTVGLSVERKIIEGRVQETVKAVVARYTAEELISKRHVVKEEIADSLTAQLRDYEILVPVGGVQITNFMFSAAFNQAIEEKQIAEQQALKATNDLERIRVEAEQKVAEAKGNAEAIRIQAEAIQRQGGKDYVTLKSVEKWDGHLPTYLGSGAVPFLEIKTSRTP